MPMYLPLMVERSWRYLLELFAQRGFVMELLAFCEDGSVAKWLQRLKELDEGLQSEA